MFSVYVVQKLQIKRNNETVTRAEIQLFRSSKKHYKNVILFLTLREIIIYNY